MNEAVLREYIRQLITEAPQRFYHGSVNPLKIGQVIGGRRFKSEFGDMEKLLEAYRPVGMHSRLTSVYMTSRPSDVYSAGGSDNNVYVVEPLDTVQRHHQGWIDDLYELTQQNADRHTLLGPRFNSTTFKTVLPAASSAARGYWLGKRSSNPGVWEYLCGSARVIRPVSLG